MPCQDADSSPPVREELQKLESLNTMVVALDTEGRIIFVNRKLRDFLGFECEELVGKNWFATCLPQKQRKTVELVFRGVMAGDMDLVEFYENPVLTKDGQEKLIAWNNNLLRDSPGVIVGTISSGKEIV
ncbi:MAG: PAS domain-containing protein [Candidatus Omnitrophica bacterium]|nr:PAS domain-containing protein [Candidatus Omnitrophota bacterium]